MYSSFIYQGLRNDFKAAMEKIDQEYLAELIKQQVCLQFDKFAQTNQTLCHSSVRVKRTCTAEVKMSSVGWRGTK